MDQALARLRDGLVPVTGTETVPLEAALGRILAAPLIAARANPPSANTAVDGYGVRHSDLPASGEVTLPLAEGRSAAGAPFRGALPPGTQFAF